MWLRLAGALLVTVAALGAFEYFGISRLVGGQAPDDVREAAHGRGRELFWFAVFLVVMATALVSALRRSATNLYRGLIPDRR